MERWLLLLLCCLCCFGGVQAVREITSHYNRELSKLLVSYASAVYCDPVSLLNWNCSRCHGLVKNFNVTSVVVDVKHCLQALVGVDEVHQAVVIAFRGTRERSVENWMEDLYFKALDLNYPGVTGAKVHHGFYNAYYNTTLRESVLEAIKNINESRHGLKYMITGHSMGGALASICGPDLVINLGLYRDDVKVVTFGQPRVGNAAFASFFNELFPGAMRVVHDHDIVPHLPPHLPVLGDRSYHHFATEVWLTSVSIGILRFDYERICDGSGEDPTCSRSVAGDSINDHFDYFDVVLGFDDDEQL